MGGNGGLIHLPHAQGAEHLHQHHAGEGFVFDHQDRHGAERRPRLARRRGLFLVRNF